MTTTGSTYRRCSCRDPETKKDMGNACPKLKHRSHGGWFYRIELPPDADGTRRPRRRGGFASETDAQAQLDQARALLSIPDADDRKALTQVGDVIEFAIRHKEPLPDYEEVRLRVHRGRSALEQPTVAQWLGEWLPGRKALAKNTYRSYESHIRLYLTPLVGEIRVDKLRVGHIADMFDAIDEYNGRIAEFRTSKDPALREAVKYRRPVGPTSMHRIRATLRKALNDAIPQGLLTFNPACHVELPPAKAPKPLVWTRARVEWWRETGKVPSAVMVWTPEQTGRFLDHAQRDRLYPLFHLITFRGLRRGEACGAHWSDLDEEACELAIRWQLLQLG